MLKVNMARYQSSVTVRLDRTHSKKKYLSRIGFLPFDGVCLVPDKVPGAGADFKVELGYAEVHAGVSNQGKTVDPD